MAERQFTVLKEFECDYGVYVVGMTYRQDQLSDALLDKLASDGVIEFLDQPKPAELDANGEVS